MYIYWGPAIDKKVIHAMLLDMITLFGVLPIAMPLLDFSTWRCNQWRSESISHPPPEFCTND